MQSSRDAIIGHSGFVGSNLVANGITGDLFNSANIGEFHSGIYQNVYCTGVPATMWRANNQPDLDAQNIDRLFDELRRGHFERLIVISTIAVFSDTSKPNLEEDETFETVTPYGSHRRAFEMMCTDAFQKVYLIRLPSLVGSGLRKNFIYDLMNPAPTFLDKNAFIEVMDLLPSRLHALIKGLYRWSSELSVYELDRDRLNQIADRNDLEAALVMAGVDSKRFTNALSMFQFYGLENLAADIERCVAWELASLNICSEPLRATDICKMLTGSGYSNGIPHVVSQNVRSRFAHRWGNDSAYLYDKCTAERWIASCFESGCGT